MKARVLKPTPEQLRASDPERSVWVAANAGSGKTHVLVERLIRLLLRGADAASVLCITFTKAAAAEMSSRLFDRLAIWTALDDDALEKDLSRMGEDGGDASLRAKARRLFTEALETPGGLKIQTIHAFCERLLHFFPVEAGLAPGFTVMDDRRSSELQDEATRSVLRETQQQSGDLSLAMRRCVERLNSEQFGQLIGGFLFELMDLRQGLHEIGREHYELVLSAALGIGNSSVESVRADLATIEPVRYRDCAELMAGFKPHFGVNVGEALSAIGLADDPTELLLRFYLNKARDKATSASHLFPATVAKAHPEAADFLLAESRRIFDLFKTLTTHETVSASGDAFVLAKTIWERMESEKRRLGLVDFSDLIGRAAQLLSTSRATQWALYKLDKGLSHILVDEAQDTSPQQWRIIEALADEFFAGAGAKQGPRTLFVVGDQKQSIYSFQGADAVAFVKKRAAFTERLATSNAGLNVVDLSISYRSVKTVLRAVDAVFPAQALTHMGIDDKNERPHTEQREGLDGVVELWPLVEEDEVEMRDPWTTPVDRPPQASPRRKLARSIAEKIDAWLSRQNPRKLLAQDRAIRADDILILFQKRGALYRMVMSELRQRGIPVAGADRLALLKSLTVQDLLMLLHWLHLPNDDHALAVILKSPLVPKPVSERELFELCYNRDRPLAQLISGENATFLTMLRDWARTQGPFAVLSRVLLQQRQAVVERLGSEALEAGNELIDAALQYENEHGVSIFGFVEWFKATETTLKRDMDKGAGEVRLMTIHGAKGLQANIVILADAADISTDPANRPKIIAVPAHARGAGLPVWKPAGTPAVTAIFEEWLANDELLEQQERNRLLYVGMTRAADELYICGATGRQGMKRGCWWETVTRALGAPKGNEPLRFGPADETAASGAQPDARVFEIPDWIQKPALPEISRRIVAPSRLAGESKSYDPAAAKRGKALHRLLQILADMPDSDRHSAERKAVQLGLHASEGQRAVSLLQLPELAPYVGPGSLGEAEIQGVLSDGREVGGRLDRLAITPHGIWLLDYKTDRFGPETLEAQHPYVRQMALYVALLKQAYPSRLVKAALLLTGRGKLEVLPDALLTAALRGVEEAVT